MPPVGRAPPFGDAAGAGPADRRPTGAAGAPAAGGTADQGRPGRGGGVTDADRRTALRFVIGRPGWRVEARTSARGGAWLPVTTADPDTGAARPWRVERTQDGLLVSGGDSGERLWAGPAMREALVEIWEAAAGIAAG